MWHTLVGALLLSEPAKAKALDDSMTSVIGDRSKESFSLSSPRFSRELLWPLNLESMLGRRAPAAFEPAILPDPHLDVAVLRLRLFLCCGPFGMEGGR